MNCEVQHLENYIRYRILIINGEQYILDMERSFWKILFPFFVWIVPSTIFKVNDPAIIEQLKESKNEKAGSSQLVFLAGFAYVLGILLTPLMNYFEISVSPLVNILLLFIALLLVALLYLSISHKRKKKLENVVILEQLSKHVVRIRPRSNKQVFKLLAAYTWLIMLDVFFFLGYIQTRNLMVLIVASGLLFGILLACRITVEEGHTTVKFLK
ncbi:DUF443 family protein [Virgibacillus sp. C22-A2]|uniref:DUF443 family protein n=1 Tax=Virgibacillus tibetensis TaxID=3042313 RepID=A0ABU6KIY4_9BACI|nr:DUF443 family protein [Virgibacillus sp. C22-A2]